MVIKKEEKGRRETKENKVHEDVAHGNFFDNGRFDIIINDSIRDVALGDYGSDISAMPSSTFSIVMNSNPNILFENFKKAY